MDSSFFLCSVATAVAAAVGFFMLFRKFRFPQDNKDTKSSSLSLPSPPTSVSLPSPPTSSSLPSPPTSLPRTWKHHVFPSFHGPDVRRAFLSHILKSFREKGINPFIDNDIPRSKSIGPELIEAIRGSKIAIVLLSKNYASSSWYLDELAEIMNCREVLDQIVMTIFYEVDPTDIKKQTGDFGKAFRKTCKGKTKEHIERWRKALEDVATIAGEHSRNWCNEADMIEKIATDISDFLNSTPSRDFDYLVGMGAHMERLEQLLRLDLDEVRMIGILGPPGIGKTTIARVLFTQLSYRFQLGTIMVNIRGSYPRPCLDEYSAQLQLQNQMMSQIIDHKDIKISHLGVAQDRLKDKKVLLVLDDVDQLGQLDALAGKNQWFGPGSQIIITTEDLSVLDAHGINHIYKVNFPSSDDAFQIFCMNAFGQKHPYDGFYDLAWEVTSLAGDLPLGLKVLGSALKGKSKQKWEKTLPILKTSLDKNIGSIIKFSYDALDDEDKYLFLYIACLFTSESPRKVKGVLAKHISSVGQRLHILAQKSLISIDEHGRISMHTLLQKFGRETAKKEFIYHGLAKRQLLDCKPFIGINFDLSETEEELNISEKALERLHDFQFVKIKGNNLAHPKRLHSLLYPSQKIRSLHWNFFQNIYLPSNFNPEFLVELNMRSSKLEKLWEGTRPLRNLKWMDLSHSIYLKELPDLSTATKLEELFLKNCSSLVELPSSIGNAINLQELDLSGCSSLLDLPSSIGNAINLERLNLQSCSSLLQLPSSIGNAINLQELNLSGCSSLLDLPSSIGNAINLQELNITRCSSLRELPSSIGNGINFQKVFLRECSSLVELPSSMNITNLKELDLAGCSSLVNLPFSLGNATNLQTLNLRDCTSLVKIPSSIESATNLQKLDLSNCSNLVELPSIGNGTKLEELNLENCSSLVELPSSINAPNLEILYLNNFSSLVELTSSINAPNLKRWYLNNCSSLMELPTLEDATNLLSLDLHNCSSLQELPPSIGTATNLQELNISGCSSLVKLPSSIGDLKKLGRFDLINCSSLVELPSSIGNLQKLSWLIMCGCSKLEALPTNINLESLERLNLTDCSQLKTFPEISTNIKYLNLIGTAIKEAPLSMRSVSRLSIFDTPYFESLKKFPPHALDIISELHFVNEDIKEVPPWVKGISRLSELRLYNCSNLVSLPQFSDSLQNLVAENCQSLERLDCSFNFPNIGLEFVNCPKLNQEARDLIMHTSSRKCAILPGTEVPDCFNHRATGGSLTIKLNKSPYPTSLRFRGCLMFVKDEEETRDDKSWMEVIIGIMDKQKDLKVQCTPSSRYIFRVLTEHIYTFEFQAEKVTSTELVFQFQTDKSKWKIGEWGLLQIEKSWD